MDLSPFQMIGIGVVAVLVIGWLVVSFSEPSPRRVSIEWISASAIFVGLLTLFVYLALRAHEAGSTFALVAFLFLCVFFGHTPHTFYIHHMGMHHAESNMWDDTSSTLTYERDNFLHFCMYWWRFLFIGMFDLLFYNWKKGRMKLFRLLILVEGGYYAAVAA